MKRIILVKQTPTANTAVPVVLSITPDLGDIAGGELLTIHGINFTGTTAVSIGGTPVIDFEVTSSNEILVTAPRHSAASGQSVLVTNTIGTNIANTLYEFWSPSLLSLTGYWDRGGYQETTAGTWTGLASAGSSTGRDFIQAIPANQPTEVGLDLYFDGINDKIEGTTAATFFGVSWSIFWLFECNSAIADPGAGNPANCPGIYDISAAGLAIGMTTTGLRAGYYDGSTWNSVIVPATLGELHLAHIRSDGTMIEASIDGSAMVQVARGNLYMGSVISLGNCYTPDFYNGMYRALGFSNTVLDDATYTKLLKWSRSCRGLKNAISVPIITGMPVPAIGDIAGGTTIIIPVDNSSGTTSATINGVALTSFIIIDGTHVQGVTGASSINTRADVVVTNAGGSSTTGNKLFRYTTTVSAISPNVGDTAGGAQRVVITIGSSASCSSATIGGIALTDFMIDDSTHVSGIPGAHAAGIVDVIVKNKAGSCIGGTGLFEYWTPAQITGIDCYLDSNKGVTDAGSGHVSIWVDQSVIGSIFQQVVDGNRPIQTASQFGTLPSIRYVQQQWVRQPKRVLASGASYFFVGKWTSADDTIDGNSINVPMTIFGDSVGSIWSCAGVSAGSLEYQQYIIGTNHYDRGSGLNDGNVRLLGWTHNLATSDLKAYVGAVQEGSSVSSVTYSTVYNGYNTIGGGYADSDGFIGDLGAIVIVSGVISSGDLTKLNSWAQQRFGTP